MKVATIQVLADDFVNDRAPEAVLMLVLIVPNLFEFFELVLDAGIEI
jgi:hypothetical protein